MLALANFSSGISQSDCESVLADFNGQLIEPLLLRRSYQTGS